VAFTADGAAAIGGDGGAIRIWSSNGGGVRTLVAEAAN